MLWLQASRDLSKMRGYENGYDVNTTNLYAENALRD